MRQFFYAFFSWFLSMKILNIVCIFMVLLSHVSIAEDEYFFTADSPGVSAGMIRLGNIEGMSDYADSVFNNPAALYRINSFSSSFFTTTFMEEVVYHNGALALRLPVGVLGLGYMSLGVDDIPHTIEVDAFDRTYYEIDYYFKYANSLIKAAYGFSSSNFVHYGIAATYYMTEFDTVKGAGYNVDAGILLNSNRIEFSFLMKNLLTSQKIEFTDSETGSNSSDGSTEKLPLQTIYSMKYKMNHFKVYGQLKTVGSDRDLYRNVAVEFHPRFLPILQLSVSYRQFPLSVYNEGEYLSETKYSGTFGLGLDLMGVHFDYAYERSDHIEYEHKHFFSMGYSF